MTVVRATPSRLYGTRTGARATEGGLGSGEEAQWSRGWRMAVYLLLAKLSPEGAKGVQKDGLVRRREIAEKVVAAGGGKVLGYYACGDAEWDVVNLFVGCVESFRSTGELLRCHSGQDNSDSHGDGRVQPATCAAAGPRLRRITRRMCKPRFRPTGPQVRARRNCVPATEVGRATSAAVLGVAAGGGAAWPRRTRSRSGRFGCSRARCVLLAAGEAHAGDGDVDPGPIRDAGGEEVVVDCCGDARVRMAAAPCGCPGRAGCMCYRPGIGALCFGYQSGGYDSTVSC
jgi:hypothetical protein